MVPALMAESVKNGTPVDIVSAVSEQRGVCHSQSSGGRKRWAIAIDAVLTICGACALLAALF